MFIFIDTETGGIGLDKSLLTASFIITDEQLKIVDKLYLSVRPDDNLYHIEAKALEINKINLIEHEKIAIPYKNAKPKVYEFIKQHSKEGADKLIPAGFGIYFDLTHVWDKLISRATWETFCSYRTMDVTSIARFLMLLGKIRSDLSGSLVSLSTYFNVYHEQEHHAESDNLATIEVLKYLIKAGG